MSMIVPSVSALPGDVLIVEDEFLIAVDLEEALRQLGVSQTRTALTLSAALACIAQRMPDLALIDVKLGEDTSFTVARTLHARGIPFVFVTGYDENVPLNEFSKALRLTKPYTLQDLHEILARAFDRRCP